MKIINVISKFDLDKQYDNQIISTYINGRTKNEEPGYVTKVDGDIVYINPGGLKLQENMSLFGMQVQLLVENILQYLLHQMVLQIQ